MRVRRSTVARIERLVRVWLPRLGLERWDVKLRFDEKRHQATCKAQPEYETAVITFNLVDIEKHLRPDELEELVVHELCHCLTKPMRGDAWAELATTRVSRAFLRAYP